MSIIKTTFLSADPISFASNLSGKWKELWIELDLLWAGISPSMRDDEWRKFENVRPTERAIDETKNWVTHKRLNTIYD
jgi:hypothetical protein